MQVYDVPLELKILIFGGFAVLSLTLYGFVWYSNWKARRKDGTDPMRAKRKIKRKRHGRAR